MGDTYDEEREGNRGRGLERENEGKPTMRV